MMFRYIRALFVGDKSVEFYWNSAGLLGGMLLLGSVVADKENFDLIFGSNNQKKVADDVIEGMKSEQAPSKDK